MTEMSRKTAQHCTLIVKYKAYNTATKNHHNSTSTLKNILELHKLPFCQESFFFLFLTNSPLLSSLINSNMLINGRNYNNHKRTN